jgi:WD40 repeat protein
MKRISLMLFFLLFCLSCFAGQKYYSIQVASNPDKEVKKTIAVYKDLISRGYFAYGESKELNGQRVQRVKVGLFKTPEEAEEYGRKFKKETGMDFFVSYARVAVDMSKSGIAAVTTPHEIWIYDGKELDNGIMLIKPDKWESTDAYAKISPDGKEIAYITNGTIFKFDVKNRKLTRLKKSDTDDLLESDLMWSPDGKYIAYVDLWDFEYPTSLWIMDADGKNDRVLVKNDFKNHRTVGRFMWNSQKDLIYYIDRETYGTESMNGENIYKVDLAGKREQVLPEKGIKKRVYNDFRIDKQELYYKYYSYGKNGKLIFSEEFSKKIE